jgi:hypothetical protein
MKKRIPIDHDKWQRRPLERARVRRILNLQSGDRQLSD